jgi:hypothetical protein
MPSGGGTTTTSWGDTDEGLLLPDKQKSLRTKGDMPSLSSDVGPWLRSVCELAGLTGAPATN